MQVTVLSTIKLKVPIPIATPKKDKIANALNFKAHPIKLITPLNKATILPPIPPTIPENLS